MKMYITEILIKNVDENEKKYVLLRLNEDAHKGDYIGDILGLFHMGLKSVPEDSWNSEFNGPEGNENINDQLVFFLTTEQIRILKNTWRESDRPFPANNALEEKQMIALQNAVMEVCESVDNGNEYMANSQKQLEKEIMDLHIKESSTKKPIMVLRNIDGGTETTVEISGTIMKGFVELTDIVAEFESLVNEKLETIWDESGGCVVELTDEHFYPLFTHYGNLIKSKKPMNRQEVFDMTELKLMQAFSEIF
jgi:hypothetical protein